MKFEWQRFIPFSAGPLPGMPFLFIIDLIRKLLKQLSFN